MKKTSKHLTVMAIIAIITLSFFVLSCDKDDDNEEETASVPQPKTITQANGLAFDGKVTISTSDPYTVADWNALCNDVVTALESAYTNATGPAQGRFRTVFANDADAQIVLVNNLANNWEVRDGDFKTLYLKTGSIATVDYSTAITRMGSETPEVGKATPAKDRVFLA